MKMFRIILGVAMALSLVAVMSSSAFAVSTYMAGFQVQNMEGSDATVVISYYNQDGTKPIADVQVTIAGNKATTFFPIAAPAGFNGSVVVSSDRKVAAIVNVLGDGGKSQASYDGSAAGATTILLPLLMKGNSGTTTWFNVQNAGSGDAAVSVAYSDGTTNSATVKQGAAVTFDQAKENHTAKVFSAKVTSTQPVVAAVMEVGTTVLYAYSGFAATATNPVMPLVNSNNGGTITGIQIQNAGTLDTNVTVSYSPAGAGTACTETLPVKAGQSNTFALFAFFNGANSTCAAGAKFVGSGRVTGNSANQPLVAIVNQLGTSTAEAYNAFDPATASGGLVMPLIMDRNGDMFTGFSIMNVGGSSTTVNCTFSGSNYVFNNGGQPIAAGGSAVDVQFNKLGAKYVGSATCTAGAGGKIIAIVNELGTTPGVDHFLVYEAINQ